MSDSSEGGLWPSVIWEYQSNSSQGNEPCQQPFPVRHSGETRHLDGNVVQRPHTEDPDKACPDSWPNSCYEVASVCAGFKVAKYVATCFTVTHN